MHSTPEPSPASQMQNSESQSSSSDTQLSAMLQSESPIRPVQVQNEQDDESALRCARRLPESAGGSRLSLRQSGQKLSVSQSWS